MPEPLTLELTPDERRTLEELRDHHPKPHEREKAAALIKVSDGHSANWVARHGLLKPRHPDTLYRWIHRYREEGVAGLRVHPGRGRKPAFSPSLRGRGRSLRGVPPPGALLPP